MGSVLAALLLIGPLIFFHELGHLIAAKLVGVKVSRFSIGFGKPFARKRIGETEYCLAPIPLGGYVLLLGQHPGETIPAQDADRALSAKPIWARAFVMAAGPLANLALPLVVLFFFFLGNTVTSPPVVGTVFSGTAAEAAGLESGDRIVAVDGVDVRSFKELQRAIRPRPDEELKVTIERDGQEFERFITPRRNMSRDAFGVLRPVGSLGVGLDAYAPQIGISDTDSPAYQAGLRTGDIITSVSGEPLERAEDLSTLMNLSSSAFAHVTFLRPRRVDAPASTLLVFEPRDASLVPDADRPSYSGIHAAHTFVLSVADESPAMLAGIKPGDRILRVEGKKVDRWDAVARAFARRGTEAPVSLEVQSLGEAPRKIEIKQRMRTVRTVYETDDVYPWHGIEPYQSSRSPAPEPIRGRISYAARASWHKTVESAGFTLAAIRQLFTSKDGLSGLGSIVGIAHMAGVAAERGPGEFIQLLAILSINLCFINLLPIPILDGGHLLFYGIEAVRRRPLGQRAREIASAVGLVFIGLLLLVALRNDIMRLWFE